MACRLFNCDFELASIVPREMANGISGHLHELQVFEKTWGSSVLVKELGELCCSMSCQEINVIAAEGVKWRG